MADTLFPLHKLNRPYPILFLIFSYGVRDKWGKRPGTHRNTQHPVVSFWERCFAIHRSYRRARLRYRA